MVNRNSMRCKIKKIIVVSLVLLIAALIGGCNSKTQEASKEGVVADNNGNVKATDYKDVSPEIMAKNESQPSYGRPNPIIHNSIEKGYLSKYGFINEAYCRYVEKYGLNVLQLNQYSIAEAVKFPEEIPAPAYVAYTGSVDLIQTEKDEKGEKLEVLYIRVHTTDSYGRETENLLAAVRPEAAIAEKKNYTKALVTVTGILTNKRVSVNLTNGNTVLAPVLIVHDLYPGRPAPAIKDNQTGRIFAAGESRFVTYKDNVLEKQSNGFEEQYSPFRYIDYDANKNQVIIGLYNNKTNRIDIRVFDCQRLEFAG